MLRLVVAGALLAAIVYLGGSWADSTVVPSVHDDLLEPKVPVPQLDANVLASAADGTRDQRLVLEPQPLRHLLQAAIDVGPTVAAALGMPADPVPPSTVRAAMAEWRGRWLWYEGELVDLAGPREGHPIRGYSIYEATIRLADGDHAIAAFSIPPEVTIQAGSWVRIDGYLLKLRDTTYPLDIRQAPMLVGRSIQRDFEDWGPVLELDPTVLAKVDDTRYSRQDTMWRTLEEDQTEALWHLAGYVRDTDDQRTFAEWRRVGILNAAEFFEPFKEHEIERGMPIRVIGTLIRRTTLAAPTNPAGIKFWTIAWIQVREYGGAMVPVWVPKRVAELPRLAQLEVRAHYYRRFAYETMEDKDRMVPLFVAANLDRYELGTSAAMRQLGMVLGGILTALMVLIWWGVRRSARSSAEHQRDMDARRRRRRERTLAAGSQTAT